ncbi:MAG: Methionyl-tRNA formyltransferase [Elusimicrobia bacterium ADurb.Bin231]|nr:MAG: Methionyl-tRNA formyltransferase [Elusimicrobia bacterium ADurb.Bin231]
MKLKTIFWGTPSYVLPVLEYTRNNEELLAVVTRCDKASGRHCRITPSPVKESAVKMGIPVFTPENLKDADFISSIKSLSPDFAVVVAYGKIIPAEIIKIFPYGCLNLHFSLLPLYRGAAPIQWTLINGEKKTGVTGFLIEEKLDTGRIISCKSLNIEHKDTLESLRERLVRLSLDVLGDSIGKIKTGFKGTAQSGNTSYAPQLKKHNGRINWSRSAIEIENFIRGLLPWPCAWSEIGTKSSSRVTIKILCAEPVNFNDADFGARAPGSLVAVQKDAGFIVKCGKGYLLVKTVHPSSKKVMSAWAFLQGHSFTPGNTILS